MSAAPVDAAGWTPDSTSASMVSEIRLQARALAGLFAAGATLALLTVLLPHSRRADVTGLLVIVADAYVVSGLLCWRVTGRRTWVLPLALAWGSTLITGVAYFSGESPSPLVFFYLWIFLYGAYFFTMRQAAAQIAYVAIAYAALLLARPPSSGVPSWWVVGMGTLLVAAILIQVMRGRAELLISRLYDAARTDPLTELTNRRGFREMLDLELARARRNQHSMAVIIGDLDHFKQVNDRGGRLVGDITLKQTAEALNGARRPTDTAGRIGGEEFALILPDTSTADAFTVAERLRDAISRRLATAEMPTTISFGLAVYPDHGQTAASLLNAADSALYTAKDSGRDRTAVHDPAADVAAVGGPQRTIEGERFLAAMLELAETVDLRFSGTARHSETVGRYALLIAQALGVPEPHAQRIRLAGMLHDIGKIAVPDAILHKPGKLTEAEFSVIKTHPALGAQILEHPSLTDIRAWVGAHHERPDGHGYPLGLAGETIALEAHILAVADAYEAMTSDRAYRPSIGPEQAQAELQRHVGTQFDARVVTAFIDVLRRESDLAEATHHHQLA